MIAWILFLLLVGHTFLFLPIQVIWWIFVSVIKFECVVYVSSAKFTCIKAGFCFSLPFWAVFVIRLWLILFPECGFWFFLLRVCVGIFFVYDLTHYFQVVIWFFCLLIECLVISVILVIIFCITSSGFCSVGLFEPHLLLGFDYFVFRECGFDFMFLCAFLFFCFVSEFGDWFANLILLILIKPSPCEFWPWVFLLK